MSNHFSLTTKRDGTSVTIACTGELDIAAAPVVEAAIEPVFESPPSTIELDWSALTFMDSTGIRLLLIIVKRAAATGIDLIWRLSDAAQRALDAVGIHDQLLRTLGEQDAGRDA